MRNLRSSGSATRSVSFSNSQRAASMLSFLSVFSPDDYHILFITSSYRRNIRTPSLSCTITMTNLAWAVLRFISFLRALIGILSTTLLSLRSLDIASTWAIVRPSLCLMVNSYCWSLMSHLTLRPLGRFAILTISNVTWSVIMLKGFIPKYCWNFSIPHTMAKHFFSVMG